MSHNEDWQAEQRYRATALGKRDEEIRRLKRQVRELQEQIDQRNAQEKWDKYDR